MKNKSSHKEARGKSTDGPISRLINRRISTKITELIVKYNVPVTPNQVSVISFLVGAASAPLYLLGLPAPAGVLVQLSSILDGTDGELARCLGIASKRGAFFDSILDRVCDIIVLISASLYSYVYQAANSISDLSIFLLAASGSLLVSYTHYRAEHDIGYHPALIGLMPSIASRDVRLFVIFIGSLLAMVRESLAVIAVLSFLYIIAKVIELWRITR